MRLRRDTIRVEESGRRFRRLILSDLKKSHPVGARFSNCQRQSPLELTKENLMKKKSASQSGLFNPRAFVAFTLCSVGTLLAIVTFAAQPSRPATPPTFGHPVISGIGGVGFEQGLRVDPSNANRLYTSAPGSESSD